MEDINKENLPKNAKKENPTEEELVSRMLKKEAMAKYRKRLKEGKKQRLKNLFISIK